MLTSSHHPPRYMSIEQPTFAEFVVYYLPREEFTRGKTLNYDDTLPPSSKNSCLDEYHYNLLVENTLANREELEAAWNVWKELGKYEHGERFRRTLFEETKPIKRHLELWEEIKDGMDGPTRDMGVFYLEWKKKGLREAKHDKDWKTWKEVVELGKSWAIDPVGCIDKNCKHYGPGGCLGKKIYR